MVPPQYYVPFVMIIGFFLLILAVFECKRRQTRRMMAEGYTFGIVPGSTMNIVAVMPPNVAPRQQNDNYAL